MPEFWRVAFKLYGAIEGPFPHQSLKVKLSKGSCKTSVNVTESDSREEESVSEVAASGREFSL